jgi:hypothetical protein
MKHRKSIHRTSRKKKARSPQGEQPDVRVLRAIGRVRQGRESTVATGARAEGTTVQVMKREAPEALVLDRSGRVIGVKPSDSYSALVEIITDRGAVDVIARGSRERELAGRHRAVVTQVLRGVIPASALDRYRDKKVGGHQLSSSFDRLVTLVQAGELDHLESLYVSPETSR